MPGDSRPVKVPVHPSSNGTSGHPPEAAEPQLSPSAGVNPDVSSVAIDRGLLANSGAPTSRAKAERPLGADALAIAELSDAGIMLRAKAGDDSAFEYLVQKYRRAMVSYMFRMAHNSAVAEDLAQEVFLRVYRSRGNYEASAKFTTWLYRIATNLAVNHARDTRNERPDKVVSLDEKDEETGQSLDVPDLSLSAEEDMVRRERMAAIRQRVQELPERQRMAVLMHKYQQMDYKQISEVLKLSESATKSLLFRAYQTLRGQLQEFL
jgi:RNA polymerase sigma-70 factor, ECF subfamily